VLEEELRADDEQRYAETRSKVRRIETAEQRRRAPVNDSEMVDEMFGFIDSHAATTDTAPAPTAFKVLVSSLYHSCFISISTCGSMGGIRARGPRFDSRDSIG